MEQLIEKYGESIGKVLALMKEKCDFNAEHNEFDWTGELKTKQIVEKTGLTEEQVKDSIQWLIARSFISQYKTFEVYSINIKL